MKAMNRFTLRGKIKVNIQWFSTAWFTIEEKILNHGLSYAYT